MRSEGQENRSDDLLLRSSKANNLPLVASLLALQSFPSAFSSALEPEEPTLTATKTTTGRRLFEEVRGGIEALQFVAMLLTISTNTITNKLLLVDSLLALFLAE